MYASLFGRRDSYIVRPSADYFDIVTRRIHLSDRVSTRRIRRRRTCPRREIRVSLVRYLHFPDDANISLVLEIFNRVSVGIASVNTRFSDQIAFTRVSVPVSVSSGEAAGCWNQDGGYRTWAAIHRIFSSISNYYYTLETAVFSIFNERLTNSYTTKSSSYRRL